MRFRFKRKDARPESPSEAWLVLPTGDRLEMTPWYLGRDPRGMHGWVLYLSSGESIDLPAEGLTFGVDVLPAMTSVALGFEQLGDGMVRLLPAPKR